MGDSTRPIRGIGYFTIKTSNYGDNLGTHLSEWIRFKIGQKDPV